jgi:hypothetical protein
VPSPCRDPSTTCSKTKPPVTAWKPGQSGNPKGRPPTSLLEPARALTAMALDRLRYIEIVGLM